MNGWILGAGAALFIAAAGGLIVQGDQLKDSRAEVVRLERDLKAETKRANNAEAAVRKAESTGAVQAQEAAIVCQGEGATLFNRGRQVGIAIGRSQCPAS